MTDAIDELERLHAAGTTGEWCHSCGDIYLLNDNRWTVAGEINPADAAFIVASHNRMPALLATLRDMREALEWIGSIHCREWPDHERSERFGHCYDKARAALAETAQKTSETSDNGNRESHPIASKDGVVRIETSRPAEAPQEPGTSSPDDAERANPWRTWDDRDDEWTERIEAAFPTRSGSHDEYATAMRMVGSRKSKGSLVALVNWLLVDLRTRDAQAREAGRVEERSAVVRYLSVWSDWVRDNEAIDGRFQALVTDTHKSNIAEGEHITRHDRAKEKP